MKDLACHYDGDRDTWYVRVPFGLPPESLNRVRAYLFRVNTDRLRSAPLGDKREYLQKALKALEEGRLEQLLSHKGEQVLFGSTARTNPDRTFSFGAAPQGKV